MEYFAYSQKEFVYKYVVMLSDTDQFKHMSFANYLKLMFLATDALFTSCLDGDFLSRSRLKLLHSRMQFKRQSVPGDAILVKVNASGLDAHRFSLLYTFVIEGGADLVGLGKQTYGLFKRGDDTPEEPPSRMTSILEPIAVDEAHLLYHY